MTNRINFVQIPADAGNVRHLGGLVFDRRNILGSLAYLDMRGEFVYSELARDFIAALYEYVTPNRISTDLPIHSYSAAIQEVIRYCRERGLDSGFRLADIDYEFLLQYRAHLSARLAHVKSDLRRRRYGGLTRLIQAASEVGLASPSMVVPRNFTWARDSDRTQPYAFDELLDLENAARNHIRELIVRLELGRKLLESGVDPRGRAKRDKNGGRYSEIPRPQRLWNQLPNLLWYVVNVLDGACLNRSQLSSGHSSFVNAVCGVWGGIHRKTDIYSHLYLLSEDLIPFAILLAKATGRNENSILELRRDCLQKVNGRYVLCYEKRRGGQRLYRKVIHDDGPFSPVRLIELIRDLTAPLVRFADENDKDKIFIGLTVRGHGANPVKSVDPTYLKAQMNREGGWCAARDLRTEAGDLFQVSLRRLRVTFLTQKYRKTGQLGKVSRDAAHTLKSTSVSYVDNDATRHLHEAAIERGIQAARSVARVIADRDIESASKKLAIDKTSAKLIISGQQDVFFAACKDFYNRPGGIANTPCDQPWGCFFCSNAVITSHVLPRVLKFKMLIEKRRETLSKVEWDAVYGSVYQLLTQDVLPQFTIEAITHAQRLADDEILFVPLELKG